MWTDSGGVTHPSSTDPVDTEGYAHIAYCQICAPHYHLPGPAPKYTGGWHPSKMPTSVLSIAGQITEEQALKIKADVDRYKERKNKVKTVIKWAAAGMLALLVFMLIFGVISFIMGVH